jgi:hypothetical protein
VVNFIKELINELWKFEIKVSGMDEVVANRLVGRFFGENSHYKLHSSNIHETYHASRNKAKEYIGKIANNNRYPLSMLNNLCCCIVQ